MQNSSCHQNDQQNQAEFMSKQAQQAESKNQQKQTVKQTAGKNQKNNPNAQAGCNK